MLIQFTGGNWIDTVFIYHIEITRDY